MPRLPAEAVALRGLVESAANQRGHSLVGSGLRLFEGMHRGVSPAPTGEASSASTAELVSPFAIGAAYERSLVPAARQRAGAHLTPEPIARGLLNLMPRAAPTDRVLDPAVGGAAFLLVAADELVARGASAVDVPARLHGVDNDPGAVAIAEAALALWCLDHQVEPHPLPSIVHGDGLLDDLPIVERVVGNPPFLNQLRSASSRDAARRDALRERFGGLLGSYTDDAWLFLAAGLAALTETGTLAMVQPLSVLAARHADPVRRHLMRTASLAALWVAVDKVFDASVHVCGVVLHQGEDAAPATTLRRGADFAAMRSATPSPGPSGWGSAAAAALDIPTVQLPLRTHAPATLGDLASATAGFRDQFYGFVPFVTEADDAPAGAEVAPLVTVGMIDVLESGWGSRDSRFAKRSFRAPVVDLDALARQDPRLAGWTAERLRPKLLVATQTRVVEVWVDDDGRAVPATPVVAVEPRDDDPASRWLLAAALTAPAISAHLLGAGFGTALALNSLKVSARDLLAIPLPGDAVGWAEAAEILRSSAPLRPGKAELARFARIIDAAYGVHDSELVGWWLQRVEGEARRRR